MKTKLTLIVPALFMMLCPGNALAGSIETWICLWNNTSERKLVLVEDVDSYDWDGFSRPDQNWHGTYVEAGRKRCEKAEINVNASGPSFSFVINGRERAQKIRMVQGYGPNDKGTSEVQTWTVIVGREPSGSVLRGQRRASSVNAEVGRYCDINRFDYKCGEFFISDVP